MREGLYPVSQSPGRAKRLKSSLLAIEREMCVERAILTDGYRFHKADPVVLSRAQLMPGLLATEGGVFQGLTPPSAREIQDLKRIAESGTGLTVRVGG